MFEGIPVRIDPLVPLTSTDPDGRVRRVACIEAQLPVVGHVLLVHPDRLEEFMQAMEVENGRRER